MPRNHPKVEAEYEESESEVEENLEEGDTDYELCPICCLPFADFGVFDCGHFACGCCALRVRTYAAQHQCPVCRQNFDQVFLFSELPPEVKDTFDKSLLSTVRLTLNKQLHCLVHGPEENDYVNKLQSFVCPVEACWKDGCQEPFDALSMLHAHLNVDHGVKYCTLCFEHRPAFLPEQITYTNGEYDRHLYGTCAKDSPSFQGHPQCLFCKRRFYDADLLLKHMLQNHYSCDVCNRGEFIFTFYKDRGSLVKHFSAMHRLCEHPDCRALDELMRVYADEIELQAHIQRAHGVARPVSLEALGFHFSMFDRVSSNMGENPASSASTHATRIVFDFVTTKQEVDLLPTKTHLRVLRDNAMWVPESSCVVPPWYFPPEEAAFRHAPKLPVRQPSTLAPLSPVKPLPANATAQPTQSTPAERVEIAEFVEPRTCEEYANILREKMRRYLTQDKFEQMKEHSVAFLGNKMLATEYYNRLTELFTAEQLDDTFPSLSGSLKNDMKREALVAARRMLTCREEQQRRSQQQEQEKERIAAERSAQKKNAWQKKKKGVEDTTDGVDANRAASRGDRKVWGKAATPPISPPPMLDDQDFPALAGGRRSAAGPAPPTGTWGKRILQRPATTTASRHGPSVTFTKNRRN